MSCLTRRKMYAICMRARMNSMPECPNVSYNPGYFEFLYAIEDRHFWFRIRNRIIKSEVENVTSDLSDGYRVLEVGCGTGYVLRMLERVCKRGRVMGIDALAECFTYAGRRTSCQLAQADILDWEPDERFHIIGCFDLLEHIEEDARALKKIYGLLEPKGVVLLTVPAFPALWSHYDVAVDHCRRYVRAEIEGLLKETGFTIEYVTYFMSLLFPLAWIRRRTKTLFNKRNDNPFGDQRSNLETADLHIGSLPNKVMELVLSPERLLIRNRCRLPFGSSLLAVARKA